MTATWDRRRGILSPAKWHIKAGVFQERNLQTETWAVRNDHWLERARRSAPKRTLADRPSEPLVLCGHGVTLRVDRGTLHIRDGLTHYPQTRLEHRLFKGDRALPPRIVMLDGTGSLSFDVLAWLSEQNIPLIRIGWQGDVISTVGGAGSAYLPDRVAWQVETRGDPAARIAFCCDLIAEKVSNSLVTLRTSVPDTEARRAAIDVGEAVINRLQRRLVESVMDIHMAEARAAGAYFKAWKGLPLRWKGLKQRPIPDRLRPGARRDARASPRLPSVRVGRDRAATPGRGCGRPKVCSCRGALASGLRPTV